MKQTIVLYLYPIKQGLKLYINLGNENESIVLYLYPIKQGLKLVIASFNIGILSCSLSLSNKTRIETYQQVIFLKHY